MNWSRARMDVILGQRGYEWAFEPVDSSPPRPKRKASKDKRKRKPPPPGAPRRQPARPTTSEPPVVMGRRALRRRFARLSLDERKAVASEFRTRLRALCDSQATFDAVEDELPAAARARAGLGSVIAPPGRRAACRPTRTALQGRLTRG